MIANIMADMIQDDVRRLERYGQLPMEIGVGKFWQDMTTPGTGSAVYVTDHNGGVTLSRSGTTTTTGGWIRSRVSSDETWGVCVAGDFDLRMRYDTGAWPGSNCNRWLSARIFDPAGTLTNSIALQRYGHGADEGAYAAGSSLSYPGLGWIDLGTADQVSGSFRFTRVGTLASAYIWKAGAWVLAGSVVRNTVPWRVHLWTGGDDTGWGLPSVSGTFSDLKLV